MKKKTKKPEQEFESEPVVARFHNSEAELKAFFKDPEVKAVMEELTTLVERRNSSLDEAIRSVKSELQRLDRDKLTIDGIGAQKKYRRWYDAEFLANHLPGDQARLVITEKLVFEVNVDVLEQMSRQGEIDNNIVREAYREEQQNPASMPGPKPYILPALPMGDE
jgi:hypothetical protein